jgi:hypothetical protein
MTGSVRSARPVAAKQMGAENRKHPRSPMCHAATIVDSAGSVLAQCVILDVSAGGARLRLTSDCDLPRWFTLHLSRNGKVRRLCETMWRDENVLGLRFHDSAARRA